jgi:hypothetical protein
LAVAELLAYQGRIHGGHRFGDVASFGRVVERPGDRVAVTETLNVFLAVPMTTGLPPLMMTCVIVVSPTTVSACGRDGNGGQDRGPERAATVARMRMIPPQDTSGLLPVARGKAWLISRAHKCASRQ